MVSEKLEFKYKEMVRLAEKSDEYAKSSFDDFKMLSALGVLLAWKPMSDIFIPDMLMAKSNKFLFIGFLAILFVIAFIGLFGLMKQSVVNFYLEEIQAFEEEVRQELQDTNTNTFRVAENWMKRGSNKQRKVALRFYSLFYMVITIYPSAILASGSKVYAIAYFVAALLIAVLHFNTAMIVHGKTRSNK